MNNEDLQHCIRWKKIKKKNTRTKSGHSTKSVKTSKFLSNGHFYALVSQNTISNFLNFSEVCENNVFEKNRDYNRPTVSSVTGKMFVCNMKCYYKNIENS